MPANSTKLTSRVVRWLRTYEVEEIDGAIGSICLYEAQTPEVIRQHSAAASLPVDEILKAADVVVRLDPAAAAARDGGKA